MNRPPSGATTPPSEQQLAELLAQFDAALAAGDSSSVEKATPESLPAKARARLERARACLLLLEELHPRSSSGAGGATRLPHADPVAVDSRVGHYRIVERLGSGGMGVVYKAEDTRLGRHVAMKFLHSRYAGDPQRVRRFQREARAASALNHPHICTVFDVGEHAGQPFLTMELVEGRPLRVDQTMPLGAVVQSVRQVAESLDVAHSAGIVHRDVKPENIMVREDGYVKVLDFGLARLLSSAGTLADLSSGHDTASGVIVGTARYMSPEQARGESVESAADVFSLGVVLYELATGRHPFHAETQFGVMHAALSQAPVTPSRLNPHVAPALEALVLQMLDKDPDARPSAADVDRSLRQLAGHVGSASLAAPGRAKQRHIVGRSGELADLHSELDAAEAGRGRIVCVSGEPGIGKTILVEEFLDRLIAADRSYVTARGRCFERLAGTEAYQPFMEALENLLRGEAREQATRIMRAVAPTWYVQVAPLASHGSSYVRRTMHARGSSQERMKRELVAFLEELARSRPVVLFFDDFHWADASTVDLLAYLAGRWGRLRLLLLVAYRPTELLLNDHPFQTVKLELQGHGLCRELSLSFLGHADVDRYLALEFPDHAFPEALAGMVHGKTEGNPLFMADLIRYLHDRGVIAEHEGRWTLAEAVPDFQRELPESVRSMIQRKIDRLDDSDRKLLAAASVQGQEFDSTVVSEALALEAAEVEERLADLERVHAFVRLADEQTFPDDSPTLRYGFVHVLYQNALYQSLQPSRRASLSAAVAGVLLTHYGDQSGSIAAELALLFEVARDHARAAQYFYLAAQNAADAFAHRESVALARRGLELLAKLPDGPRRTELELGLQMTLGLQVQLTQGFAAAEAEQSYRGAQRLLESLPESPQRAPVLWGLWMFEDVRAQHRASLRFAQRLLALAEESGDTSVRLQAHQGLSISSLFLGNLAECLSHMEQAVQWYDFDRHQTNAFLYGQDPAVASLAFGANALWLLGFADQALARSREAVALADRVAHPNTQAVALYFGGLLHLLRREPREVMKTAAALTRVSEEHGFVMWRGGATFLRGWALCEMKSVHEGIEQIRQGHEVWRGTGAEVMRPHHSAMVADTLLDAGRHDEAQHWLQRAEEAVRGDEECFYHADIVRLQAELILRRAEADCAAEDRAVADSVVDQAAALFRQAVALAAAQEAMSLQLRALVSLARLLRDRDEFGEVRERLREVYHWFTEGLETLDLREAKALLGSEA